MKIIRAKVTTNSADDKHHRVKINLPGVFDNLLVDNNNGLYLRKDDTVYVVVGPNYTEPLILGRCSGQLELQDLVDVINGLIDVINDDKDAFEKHTHTLTPDMGTMIVSPAGPCVVSPPGIPLTTPKDSTGIADKNFGKKLDKIEPDDLLY